MALIVGSRRLEVAQRLLEITKAEQTRRVGEEQARTRVLNDGRLATGQVAEGTIAEPGVLQADARGLGAAEFATGCLDVVPVVPRGARDSQRFAHTPTAVAQYRLVRPRARDRQLEGHRRAPGEVQERKKAVALPVGVVLAPEVHPSAPPAGDGGVRRRGVGRSDWPGW